MKDIVEKYNALRKQGVKPDIANLKSGMAELLQSINDLPRKERIERAIELAALGVKPYTRVLWTTGNETEDDGLVFTLTPVGSGKPTKVPERGVKLLSTCVKPASGLDVWTEFVHFTGNRAQAGNGHFLVDVPEIGPEDWRGACVKPSIALVDTKFKYPDYHQLLPHQYSGAYPVNLAKWRAELSEAVRLFKSVLGVLNDSTPNCVLPIVVPGEVPVRFGIDYLLQIVTVFMAYGETDAVFSIEGKTNDRLILRGNNCTALQMCISGAPSKFQIAPMIVDPESAELF